MGDTVSRRCAGRMQVRRADVRAARARACAGGSSHRLRQREEDLARGAGGRIPASRAAHQGGPAHPPAAQGDGLGRSRAGNPRRHPAAARLQPRVGRVHRAARPALALGGGPDQAHLAGGRAGGALTAGDRHVAAHGRGAGLAGKAARLVRPAAGRARREGLGGVRPARVGAVQVRPHASRVLQLGPARRPRRGVRRRRQDARPHRGRPRFRSHPRFRGGGGERGGALRKVDRLLRREDARARPVVSVGGGALRKPDRRVVRQAGRDAAGGALSRRGNFLERPSLRHPRRALGGGPIRSSRRRCSTCPPGLCWRNSSRSGAAPSAAPTSSWPSTSRGA